MTKANSYTIGKAAFLAGKQRDPMKDHNLTKALQSKSSESHHPTSPGAEMTESQRRKLEEKLNDWFRGWDDAHNESLEK